MKKYFFRPSALGNTNRFIASMLLREVVEPSRYMKRGSVSEQIAFRGTTAVEAECVFIPDSLPDNPATGKRWATWAAWETAHQVSRSDPRAISKELFNQCCGAAKAIRSAVGEIKGQWKWQVKGSCELGVQVPDGYDDGIEGTCDILGEDCVYDVKVVGRVEESSGDDGVESRVDSEALWSTYGYQVSSYCEIFKKPKAALIIVFPVDKACLHWDYTTVYYQPKPKQEIVERCESLLKSILRISFGLVSNSSIAEPLVQPASPVSI